MIVRKVFLPYRMIALPLLAFGALTPFLAGESRADGDPLPKRWLVFGLLGSTSTPVPLKTDAGTPIEADVKSPETGFGLGLEVDFERVLAFSFRPSLLFRELNYTESNGVDSQTTTRQTTSVHAPLQVLIIPKRWFFLGVGVYGDYEFQAGDGSDFGSVYSAGFNLNLGKKAGLQVSLNYNSSFTAFRNITAREFILTTGIRFGGNKVPSLD